MTAPATQVGRAQVVEAAGMDSDIDADYAARLLEAGSFFRLDLSGAPRSGCRVLGGARTERRCRAAPGGSRPTVELHRDPDGVRTELYPSMRTANDVLDSCRIVRSQPSERRHSRVKAK